jgi:hypothetical protein
MNGEHNPGFDGAALGGAEFGREGLSPRAWRWIAISQLWMLAGFAGMSLVVIAALSVVHGGAGHGRDELLVLALAGALLMVLAWRGVATVLQRADDEDGRGPGHGASEPPRNPVRTNPAQAALSGSPR